METQHDILVQNKRKIQFKFSIYRKFTVIRGDSATGKTTNAKENAHELDHNLHRKTF